MRNALLCRSGHNEHNEAACTPSRGARQRHVQPAQADSHTRHSKHTLSVVCHDGRVVADMLNERPSAGTMPATRCPPASPAAAEPAKRAGAGVHCCEAAACTHVIASRLQTTHTTMTKQALIR